MVHPTSTNPAVSVPASAAATDGAPTSVAVANNAPTPVAAAEPLPPLSAVKGLKSKHTKTYNAFSAEFNQAAPHLTTIYFPADPTEIPVEVEARKDLADKIEDELGVLGLFISNITTKLSRFVTARENLSAMKAHPDITSEVLISIENGLMDINADDTKAQADSLLDQLRSLVTIYEKGMTTLRPSAEVETPARTTPPVSSSPFRNYGDSHSEPGIVRPSRQYPVIPSFPDVPFHMFEQKLDRQTEAMSSVMRDGFARIESALVSGLERGLSKLSIPPLGEHPLSFPHPPPPGLAYGIHHSQPRPDSPHPPTRFSHPTYIRPQTLQPVPVSAFSHNSYANNPIPHNPSHTMPHIPALAHDPPFIPTDQRPPPSSGFPTAFKSNAGFTNYNSVREAQYAVQESPYQHARLYQDGAAVNETCPAPHPQPSPVIPRTILPGDQNPFSQAKTGSRLPEIKLATFNGDPKEWRNFKATFEVVVDQRDISEVEKMLHLKQSLQGEALEAIGMYENTDYAKAWAQVQEIYGHKPYLTDRLVRELEAIPRATHSPLAQKACLNQVRGLVSMLPDCEESTNPVLHSLVFNKFAPAILEKLVEKKCADKKWLEWTLQQLFSFISDEIALLERKQELLGPAYSMTSVNAMYSHPTPVSSSSHRTRSPSPRPAPCTFCKSERHLAKDCTRTPTLEARRDFIQRNSLCYNCRSSKHMSKECPNPPCSVCDRYHDVSICPKYHNWNRDAYRGRSPSAVRSRQGQSPKRFPSRTPSRPTTPISSPNRRPRTPSRERGRQTERRPFSEGRSNSKGMEDQ